MLELLSLVLLILLTGPIGEKKNPCCFRILFFTLPHPTPLVTGSEEVILEFFEFALLQHGPLACAVITLTLGQKSVGSGHAPKPRVISDLMTLRRLGPVGLVAQAFTLSCSEGGIRKSKVIVTLLLFAPQLDQDSISKFRKKKGKMFAGVGEALGSSSGPFLVGV